MTDARYAHLRRGLEQLTSQQLERVLAADQLCLDEFNYDEQTGFY